MALDGFKDGRFSGSTIITCSQLGACTVFAYRLNLVFCFSKIGPSGFWFIVYPHISLYDCFCEVTYYSNDEIAIGA